MKHLLFICVLAGCRDDVQLLSVDAPPAIVDGSTDGLMCVPTNSSCNVDMPCCGNPCTKDGVCQGSCNAEGMQCTRSQDCCRLDCNGGICQPPSLCKATGAQCAGDVECCCGSCMTGQCVVAPISLFLPCPQGEDWHCVQGFCNNGTCAMNATCRGNGLSCAVNHDCCSGYCFMAHCELPSCSPSG